MSFESSRPGRSGHQRSPNLWLRTLQSGWWYVPLVHAGLPALAWWLPNRSRASVPRIIRLLGKAVALGGGLLTATSVVTLVRYGQGTPAPHDPPQLFVCHGPYRFCRNPMELGNLLALLGRAIALGSPRLALAAAIFAGATQVWIVLVEEPYLLRHFGADYEQYRRHVPRWGWRGVRTTRNE